MSSRSQRRKRRLLTGVAVVVGILVVAVAVWAGWTALSAKKTLASADQVQRIRPAEARAMLDKGEALLYDVRSRGAYQVRHATGAIALPEAELDGLANTLPKNKALVLY